MGRVEIVGYVISFCSTVGVLKTHLFKKDFSIDDLQHFPKQVSQNHFSSLL